MDIHKPHAPHSWGEFLREIGVIFCGVLIALALEQAVVWVRDRHVAADTRASLREEVASALAYIAARDAVERCVGDRLDAVASLLDGATGGEQMVGTRWIGSPPSETFPQVELNAATASCGLRLLDANEKRQIAKIYENMALYRVASDREWYAWGQLRSLQRPGSAASDADRARLQGALQEARTADWDLRAFGHLATEQSANAGIVPGPRPANRYLTRSVCLPITTPRAEAVARIDAPYALPE